MCHNRKFITKHAYFLKILQQKKKKKKKKKNKGKFSEKKSDIFHIYSQNINCGYSLEPPRRGDSNEHTIYVFLAK